MSELEQQSFGEESVQAHQGWREMEVANPVKVDDGLAEYGPDLAGIQGAADELTRSRDAAQTAKEGRPVDTERFYRHQGGPKAGERMPEQESITAEQAAHDLTVARNQDESTKDWDERNELQRLIDEARGNVTSEQLLAEPPPVFDLQQQPQPEQPQPVQDTQLSDHERMTKVLQENPQLLAGVQAYVEQANAQYQAAITHNAHVAAAALVSNFPELQNLQPHEIGTAIQVIAQRDGPRAQQIVNFIERIEPLTRQAVQVQQQQQQRQVAAYQQWEANNRAQFQQAAKQHDAAYENWCKQEGLSQKDQEAIRQEAFAILREGGNDEAIANAWNSNWAFRSATAQITLAEAARARLARRGAESKRYRPVPAVQRPGSPEARIPEGDIHLGRLEKRLDSIGSVKAAAELLIAQRARRR
jgi:hypothetical protein